MGGGGRGAKNICDQFRKSDFRQLQHVRSLGLLTKESGSSYYGDLEVSMENPIKIDHFRGARCDRVAPSKHPSMFLEPP